MFISKRTGREDILLRDEHACVIFGTEDIHLILVMIIQPFPRFS